MSPLNHGSYIFILEYRFIPLICLVTGAKADAISNYVTKTWQKGQIQKAKRE